MGDVIDTPGLATFSVNLSNKKWYVLLSALSQHGTTSLQPATFTFSFYFVSTHLCVLARLVTYIKENNRTAPLAKIYNKNHNVY